MRLTIDHYLGQLAERDELDILLRNLLVVEKYEVVKKASRGKREFGVDVAAVKREADGHHLYLFQAKAGDLNRDTWNVGKNSVRSSLEEAIDKPFEAFAKLQSAPVKRHLIIVFNGYVKDDVSDLLDGFVKSQTKSRDDLEITYWNIDTLGEKVQRSLVNEGLLPVVDAMALKKTLAFADVVDYQFIELKGILTKLTDALTSTSAQKLRRLFSIVRMLGRMTAEYARQGGTYKNAIVASEMLILHMAYWCQKKEVTTPTAREQFDLLLEDYATDLSRLVDKLEPALKLKHGLAVGGLTESLEYPLRTFEILGLVSVYALLKMHLGQDEQERVLKLIDDVISNNPSSHRPLLDNHGIDMCLAALAFMYGGRADVVPYVAVRVLDGLGVCKRLNRPLPELHNNLDYVIEAIAYGEKPLGYTDGSSTIISMLFEFLLLLPSEQASSFYDNLKDAFEGINLQHWYPPGNYSELLFRQEIRGGFTETGVELPGSIERFRDEVRQRHERFSSDWFSDDFSNKVNGFAAFIAFRHFRTPVYPHLWREFLNLQGFSDKATEL